MGLCLSDLSTRRSSKGVKKPTVNPNNVLIANSRAGSTKMMEPMELLLGL